MMALPTYKMYWLQYRHFCKLKQSCFACHRYLQKPSTYMHSKLERQFCNINIVPEIVIKCPNCNCKLMSQSCQRAHKLLCYSKGFFGWFCDLCKTFTYRSKSLNSEQLKKIIFVILQLKSIWMYYMSVRKVRTVKKHFINFHV